MCAHVRGLPLLTWNKRRKRKNLRTKRQEGGGGGVRERLVPFFSSSLFPSQDKIVTCASRVLMQWRLRINPLLDCSLHPYHAISSFIVVCNSLFIIRQYIGRARVIAWLSNVEYVACIYVYAFLLHLTLKACGLLEMLYTTGLCELFFLNFEYDSRGEIKNVTSTYVIYCDGKIFLCNFE